MKLVYILFLIFTVTFQIVNMRKIKASPVCTNYIIGYGSLMNKESREQEDKRLIGLPFYNVNVKGFQRSFNYNCDHADNWLYDYAALGLIENSSKDFDGVMFCIPEGKKVFKSFDKREANYNRVKVDLKSITCEGECNTILNSSEKIPNVYLYTIKPEMAETFKGPTSEIPLSQSYIDVVIYGLLKDCKVIDNVEPQNCERALKFVRTTGDWNSKYYRNDRQGRTDADLKNLGINVRENCNNNPIKKKVCFTHNEVDNVIIKGTKKNVAWKDKLSKTQNFEPKTKRQLLYGYVPPSSARKFRVR